MKKIIVPKIPDLLSTLPTADSYAGLSQKQLLEKVSLLHTQLIKINKYLVQLHRLSVYNYDYSDHGSVSISIPETNKGFLLDSAIRFRGEWNPQTNTPTLEKTDTSKVGWSYIANADGCIPSGEVEVKKGDFILYDSEGVLFNLSARTYEGVLEQLKKKISKDGSVAMEGDLNLGGNDIDVVKSIWFKEGGFIGNLDGNDFTIWLPNDEVFRFDQDGLDMFLKKLTNVAKGVNSKDGANMENINDIKNGTTIVKKAEQDASGNVITSTYETKTDATSKLALKADKTALAVTDQNIVNLQNNKVDKTTKVIGINLKDDILITEFKTALGNATHSVAGLLSAEDKTHLDGLVALLENSDGNTVVDTIGEILAIFNNYPEGADLVTALNGKVDKVAGKALSQNNFTDALKNKLDNLKTRAQMDADLDALENTKVDKVSGKGLSTNDFTDYYKYKLEQWIVLAGHIYIDGETFLTSPITPIDGGGFNDFIPQGIIEGGEW